MNCWYIDASTKCCSLTKENLEHLAAECFTEGYAEDITGKDLRFYFKLKRNAKAFGQFYLLHHTKSHSDNGAKFDGKDEV